jgi:hypothetical protein
MKKIFYTTTICILFTLANFAHAMPRPDLYPNQHLKNVGKSHADRDIGECSIAADDYVGSDSKDRTALKGAAKGAALGALGATIMKGNAGRGAGAGAAIGGLKGAGQKARTNREGSPEYKKYVEACLEDRGYKVVGWK